MLHLELSSSEYSRLEGLYRSHSNTQVRGGAHALLLFSKGYKRNEIADILGRKLDTISQWYYRYRSDDCWDLHDAPRTGRPTKISSDIKKTL